MPARKEHGMDTIANTQARGFAGEWHIRAVGALALVWYAIGFAQFGPSGLSAAGMSGWTQAALGASLWGGFVAGGLLLMRSRFAVQASVVALMGMMVTSLGHFVLAATPANLYAMPMLLGMWLITLPIVLYASRVHALGLLR